MTVWAYYRVSTDKQDYESQKIGVVEYASRVGLAIDREIIDDGVSGIIEAKRRKLNIILHQMQRGDIIITSELSRLGRSTADVINTCNSIAKKGVNCHLVKQGIDIDQTPMGKMMIAVLSAFAEMERDLISIRTKEGMARRRMQGLYTGRKMGAKNLKRILDDVDPNGIWDLMADGWSQRAIAKKFKVAPTTINTWVKEHNAYN